MMPTKRKSSCSSSSSDGKESTRSFHTKDGTIGPAGVIAALARTQRRVFSSASTSVSPKKLKRFQKDSPSTPSRRTSVPERTVSAATKAAAYRNASVVDLCSSSSDDEDTPKFSPRPTIGTTDSKLSPRPKSISYFDEDSDEDDDPFTISSTTPKLPSRSKTIASTKSKLPPHRKAIVSIKSKLSPRTKTIAFDEESDEDDDHSLPKLSPRSHCIASTKSNFSPRRPRTIASTKPKLSHRPPRKDPPEENKTPTKASDAAAVGTGVASGATLHGTKTPPVDICTSDVERETDANDNDCAALADPPKAPQPPWAELFLVAKAKVANATKAPSTKSQGLCSPALEARPPSVSVAATDGNEWNAVPSQVRPRWKEFSQKLAKDKAMTLDREDVTTNHTTRAAGVTNTTDRAPSTFPSHLGVLETISTERKRHFLTVMAPESLSPEAIEAEDWFYADYLAVSDAFSERFGSLTTKDLEELVRGSFSVPEGMVSVHDILRTYREKLFRKRAASAALEKKPNKSTTSTTSERQKESTGAEEPLTAAIGMDFDGNASNTGKELAEAESSFQWDRSFIRLLPKDQSGGKASGTGLPVGTRDEYNVERKDETKINDVHEGRRRQDCVGVDSPGKSQSIGKHRDHPSIDNVTTPSEESQLTEKEENEFESPILFEKDLPDNETSFELKDADEGGGVTTRVPNEEDDSIENSIVECGGDDKSSAETTAGHLVAVREARAILGEIVTNVVDKVTNGCRQEEKDPGETKTKIPFADAVLRQLRLEGLEEVVPMTSIEDTKEGENHPLVIVSAKQLLILALPLVSIAGILRRLGLFDVSNSILEGCFRTFFQLHVLGWLLSPIFKHGAKHPGLVGCYALFMIVLASYEASSRTKYTHDDQFIIIVQSLILNIGWVALWAFGVILKPRPAWNPRYLLPIIGMLLGNSINGLSITLDTITTSLVEKQSEIDLYLSFGANQYEAVSSIVTHAIQKGMTPSLNMMCVVGIVSIPGMMTGQILGGSSPMVAARYQAMIIFLIVLSTLSTTLLSSCLTVMSAFCSHQIPRPDRFVKNRKRGLARLILWMWGYVFGGRSNLVPVGPNGISHGNGGVLLPEVTNTTPRPSATGFHIRPLKKGSVVSDGAGMNSLVQASGLNRHFMVKDGSDDDTIDALDTDRHRVLFQDLSFRVNEGDLLLVSGPSGTGKSQLLRMMAGLTPLQEGTLLLQGRSWNDDYNGNHAVEWRRQIRYVTQTKIQIPGTPRQFLKKIQSFKSWRADDDLSGDAVIDYDAMKHVSHHIRQWGMGLECLDKEWSILSGGESQRVLMAIALASRPKILLFDESTSALDHESKLAVETSIKDFVEDHEGGILWVSHDEQQAERMMDDSESNGDCGP